MNNTLNGLHDRLSRINNAFIGLPESARGGASSRSLAAEEAEATGGPGRKSWSSPRARVIGVGLVSLQRGDQAGTVWRLRVARRGLLPRVEERGACARARRLSKQAKVRGQVLSCCVRTVVRSAWEPWLSRTTKTHDAPEEETESPYSLVRRIFIAPFLLLPPGFDILHAHLTLWTAHRRRNWQNKVRVTLPCQGNARRRRCSLTSLASLLARTTHTYAGTYIRKRVRTVSRWPHYRLGTAGRFSEQICTRSRKASSLRNVILTTLRNRRYKSMFDLSWANRETYF